MEPVLVDGEWREPISVSSFHAINPNLDLPLDEEFPVSALSDVDSALNAGSAAARQLRDLPRGLLADFLDAYADAIDADAKRIVPTAHDETGLPPHRDSKRSFPAPPIN